MKHANDFLLQAQKHSFALLDAAEEQGLIIAGKTEQQLCAEIADLGARSFGITEHWHKKIVRAGINTTVSYSGHPADRVILEDDIIFVDFGPIVNGWEADIGRTYVLGNDPIKQKIKNDVEVAWEEARKWHEEQSNLSGADFFHYLTQLANRYGWEFGGEIGGHIVGRFPHEQLPAGDMGLDVHPDNHSNIKQNHSQGNDRFWILELQFVDRQKGIGAYIEKLI